MVLQQGRSQPTQPVKINQAYPPVLSHIPDCDHSPWHHLIRSSAIALLSLGAFTASPSLAQSSADSTSDQPSPSLPLPAGLGIVGVSGAIAIGALALADNQRRAKQRSILQKRDLEIKLAEAIAQQENLEAKLEGAITQLKSSDQQHHELTHQAETMRLKRHRTVIAHRNTHTQLKQHRKEIERLLETIKKVSDGERRLRAKLEDEQALSFELKQAAEFHQEELEKERASKEFLQKQVQVLTEQHQSQTITIPPPKQLRKPVLNVTSDSDHPTKIALISLEADLDIDEHQSIIRDALEEGLKSVVSDNDLQQGTRFRRPDVLQGVLDNYQWWHTETRSGGSEIVLTSSEADLYADEHKSIIRDALRVGLKKVASSGDNYSDEGIRQEVILQSIVDSNDWGKENQKRRRAIRRVFKNYTRLGRREKSALNKVGISITSKNKHYKACFESDDRYTVSFAVTPSDTNRGGENTASYICKRFF